MIKPEYRVLYNQDCTDLFWITREPITPIHVDKMVDEVADGGADVMLINPNTQLVSYPSSVWQTFWEGYTPGDQTFFGSPEDGSLEDRAHWVSQMQRLSLQCDYLARALGRCRQRGVTPGVSVRMNDMHDAPWPDSHLFSRFYREHPQYRLPDIPARGWASRSLDYEHAEVREHYLALIGELVNDYDVEVVELDFLRFTAYFDREELLHHRQTMTGFMVQVRDLLNRTGRQIALIPRVAATPGAALEQGFDVQAWAQAGLIEAVSVGMFLNTGWEMAVERYRDLVGENVAIYACSDSPAARWDGLPYEGISVNRQLLRGFAAGYLATGADGVEMFNFFCAREPGNPIGLDPDFASLAEMRDLASLRDKPRRHLLTAGVSQMEVDLPLQVPVVLESGHSRRFEMLLAAEAPGQQAACRVIFEGKALPSALWLRVNETPIGHALEIAPGPKGERQAHLAVFALASGVIQDGRNELVVRCEGQTVTILGLDVQIGQVSAK